MTTFTLIASVAAGLFAGASSYVTFVQHPAWVECGPALAIREFGPSTRRAAVMQGLLAVIGLVAGVVAWTQAAGTEWMIGGLLLGALVPFTLIVIRPMNHRLLDPGLDPGSSEARDLLRRWGHLHAVRTVVGVVVLVLFVVLAMQS